MEPEEGHQQLACPCRCRMRARAAAGARTASQPELARAVDLSAGRGAAASRVEFHRRVVGHVNPHVHMGAPRGSAIRTPAPPIARCPRPGRSPGHPGGRRPAKDDPIRPASSGNPARRHGPTGGRVRSASAGPAGGVSLWSWERSRTGMPGNRPAAPPNATWLSSGAWSSRASFCCLPSSMRKTPLGGLGLGPEDVARMIGLFVETAGGVGRRRSGRQRPRARTNARRSGASCGGRSVRTRISPGPAGRKWRCSGAIPSRRRRPLICLSNLACQSGWIIPSNTSRIIRFWSAVKKSLLDRRRRDPPVVGHPRPQQAALGIQVLPVEAEHVALPVAERVVQQLDDRLRRAVRIGPQRGSGPAKSRGDYRSGGACSHGAQESASAAEIGILFTLRAGAAVCRHG